MAREAGDGRLPCARGSSTRPALACLPHRPPPGVIPLPAEVAVTDARRRGSVLKLAGASYLGTALAIVTGPVVARALGAEGRGEVAAATVYFSILTLVVGLGLPTSVSHAVATKAHPSSAVLGSVLRFVGFLAVPMAGLAVLLVHGPLSGLRGPGRLGAGLLVACVPLGVLTNCLASMLVAEGALGPIAWLRLGPLVVTAVATVVLYAFHALSVGVLLAVTIMVTAATALASAALVRVRPGGRAPIRGLVAFGLRGYGGNLAVFATHMVDQAFILPALGARPLGYYALAVSISAVPNSIALAIYSRYFSLVAEAGDTDRRVALMSKALGLTFVVSLAASVAIAAGAPLLVPLLYGRDFTKSVVPLLVLMPGTVVFCLSMVGESFLAAVGRPGRVTLAELSGFAVTLVGLPIVVPRWGIVGAAWLSSGAYAVVLGCCLRFLRQVGPVTIRFRVVDLVELRSAAAASLRAVRSRPSSAPGDEKEAGAAPGGPGGERPQRDAAPVEDGVGPGVHEF